MNVAVVIPTYNERENVDAIARAVLSEIPHAKLLIVDDNSPDGTGDLAERSAAELSPRVRVLHRTKKEGLGAAYVDGFQHALETWPETDCIVQMDADFSHDPSYLKPMTEACRSADLVVGSRYTSGISIVNWPLHRLIVSRLGTAFARLTTGLPITDCTSGFKCWRASTLREIGLQTIRSNGYVFQVETSFRAWHSGFRVLDCPIIFYERRHGSSKLSLRIAMEAFFVCLRLAAVRLKYSFVQTKPRRTAQHEALAPRATNQRARHR